MASQSGSQDAAVSGLNLVEVTAAVAVDGVEQQGSQLRSSVTWPLPLGLGVGSSLGTSTPMIRWPRSPLRSVLKIRPFGQWGRRGPCRCAGGPVSSGDR